MDSILKSGGGSWCAFYHDAGRHPYPVLIFEGNNAEDCAGSFI